MSLKDLVIFPLAGLMVVYSSAGAICFQGEIKLTQNTSVRDETFSLAVDAHTWEIDYHEGANTVHYYCDGTNIFSTFFSDSSYHFDPVQNRLIASSNTNNNLSAAGSISEGTIPIYAPVFAKLPWLALASQQQSGSATNNSWILPPWTDPYFDAESYIYTPEVGLLDLTNGLPKNVQWIVGKNEELAASKNSLLGTETISDEIRNKHITRIKRYKPGFIGGEYIVKNTTNYLHSTYPTAFRLTRYSADSGNILEVFEGAVTNIVEIAGTEHQLPIPKKGVSIMDYRFRTNDIDHIQYFIMTNWPAEKDMSKLWKLAAETKVKPMRNIGDPRPVDRFRGAIFGCVFLLITIGFLVFMFKSKKARNEN